MSTPAGWYPDPTGRHQNRWFDGDDWTDQVADGQAVGVDPVRGGGTPTTQATPAVDPGATQAVPTPTPAAYQPIEPTPAPYQAAAPPSTPPPGVPVAGTYTGPTGSSAGGGQNRTLLFAGIAVVVIAVVVGLVLTLGGGDDGGGSENAADSSSSDDGGEQSTTTTEDDPSASDLFDDMADDANGDGSSGDIFGTDDDPADEPTDTEVGGVYPQAVIDTFTDSCTSQGAPDSFCGCIIDVLQRDVAYDRFVEIDQALSEDPTDIPPELNAAVEECQN